MAIAIHGPSGGGTDASGATAAAGQVLSPYTFIGAAGTLETGSILSKSAQTYTPGTASQQIAAGQYLAGAQTIAGDANLAAANIVSGKSIFGVAGSAAAVKGQYMDTSPLLTYYAPTTTLYVGPDLTAGGALAIYYTSSVIPANAEQIFAFNLIVPPNDWDNQWWGMLYYSSTQGKLQYVTSHSMPAEQYKCSCTFGTTSEIIIPAANGLTWPLEKQGDYLASIVCF